MDVCGIGSFAVLSPYVVLDHSLRFRNLCRAPCSYLHALLAVHASNLFIPGHYLLLQSLAGNLMLRERAAPLASSRTDLAHAPLVIFCRVLLCLLLYLRLDPA